MTSPQPATREDRTRRPPQVDAAAVALSRRKRGYVRTLRAGGATIGRGCRIEGPLHIVNAGTDYSGLRLGEGVVLGPGTLIDLAAPVMIGDRVLLEMRVMVVTTPEGPGASTPRAISIGSDVRIGAGAILAAGIHVGDDAVVDAHAIVNVDVPAGWRYETGPLLDLSHRG